MITFYKCVSWELLCKCNRFSFHLFKTKSVKKWQTFSKSAGNNCLVFVYTGPMHHSWKLHKLFFFWMPMCSGIKTMKNDATPRSWNVLQQFLSKRQNEKRKKELIKINAECHQFEHHHQNLFMQISVGYSLNWVSSDNF